MALFADIILTVHFLFVLFVVGGLILIWTGAALRWRWIRNSWFRLAHLAAIVFVAAESLIGVACPLTQWENALRPGDSYGGSFIQSWLHRLLYYDLPESVFTLAHILFALAVIITFFAIRPYPRKKKTS
jgi:hypothetical protein